MLPPNGGSEHPRTQAVPGWWRGYQRDVVKLISRYPDGMTGIALLLLRFSCAAAAFPCRVASATLKIVPVLGHPAAVPFDACADAID